MILPFSTQINGKPNYFIEKIWLGLLRSHLNLIGYHRFRDEAAINNVIDQWDIPDSIHPKLHTIREDKTDRWKAGNKIDFFINCRQPTMFRFAPVLPVVSVQKIEIKWIPLTIPLGERRPWVRIDGKQIYTIDQIDEEQILQLAQNDGFDTIEDFFVYFDKDFTGKIIHWTDFRY
ncbi:hypothetical protein [Flavobacterium gilvum]|uniref:Uncharacterized protein n=1 Tax=Flavobacterium gilvum TaxID=1492737 RepID=A0AAC9I3P9_9FLAO|nr:hypothetical protein [Flavobacterium gilvum]AOW09500.1 hypothetical protein EM308_08310 [Flavobacterium gilvum]KFC60006.1 hypothetical protein FEM08_11850 [Flavobacterium gilvum]